MGQEQSSTNRRRAAPLLLGQTPFCFTAAVGDMLHVLAPGEVKAGAAADAAAAAEPPAAAPNTFKKKSRFGAAMSMAKKGAALAAKGAKAGAKMLMGSTLRPRLIPQAEATRTCFLCLCGTSPEQAGKAAAYGVPCYVRANVAGGAVLRAATTEAGRYVFSGTELDGALPVIVVSCSGKTPGSAILIGDQFLVLTDSGERVFIFAGSADGGIELQTSPREEVQTGASAMFVAAAVPAELAAPKQAPAASSAGASTSPTGGMGLSDTSMFAGLLGSMAVAGAVGGQVAQDQVVKDFATARYTGDNGLTKAMGDLSMARNLSQSGPGRFLVNMVVSQGVSMAIGSATGAAGGGRRK